MIRDFQLISRLGEGAYSSVYKVKRMTDGIEYALKRVKIGSLSEKEKENALNEIRILASVRHPNIIQYKEVFVDEPSSSLWYFLSNMRNIAGHSMIMEYCNGGDLFQRITGYQKKGKMMEEEDIWSFFIQITSGLKSLHDQNIFHRDLKSANVFLMNDGRVVLGDMNVSKIAKKGLLYTQTGTPYYASPEVWKDQPYDSKSDIWSLGCVLYEMATLRPPFKADDMEGLFKKVVRGFYNKIPSHYSADLNSVIRATLQVSPQLRPSCAKILSMPGVLKNMGDQILVPDESNKDLLKTIHWPRYVSFLTERLPKANYQKIQTKKVDKVRFVKTLGERSNFHQSTLPRKEYSASEEPKVSLPAINNVKKETGNSGQNDSPTENYPRAYYSSNSPAPTHSKQIADRTPSQKPSIGLGNSGASRAISNDKSRYLSEVINESRSHIGGISPQIRVKKTLLGNNQPKPISIVSPYIPETNTVNYSMNVGNPYSLNNSPVKVNYLNLNIGGGLPNSGRSQHYNVSRHSRESSLPANYGDSSARARQLGLEVITGMEKRGRTKLQPLS